MSDTGWRWTSKGPALLIGIAMIFGGALVTHGRWRYSVPIGAALIAGGFLTVVYSTTVHQWCTPVGAAAFGKEWGAAFWHGPSAWDCWHLINPMGPKGR